MHMDSMDEISEIRQRRLEALLKEIKEREMSVSAGGELKRKYDRPVPLSRSNFSNFIDENELVIVDCWAQWCKPCLAIAPKIEALAREYAGKVAFGKLNVDEETSVAQHFGVMSIPTLLIFRNGQLVDRIVGNMPKELLERKIRNYAGSI